MNKYLAIIGMYNSNITIIKNIISALEKQTIPPDKIVLWINSDENNITKVAQLQDIIEIETESLLNGKIDIIKCNTNRGVYDRFSAGLLYDYDRILILDDDTIPGSKWVENCYNTIEQVGDESIIGYRGIKLHPETLYDIEAYEKGNETIKEVSLVGHSWFVKKKHIIELFKDEPINKFNGEDSHLAACNQLAYGTKCYVPKQLLSERDTWGSLMQEQLGAQPGRLSTSLGANKHFIQRQEVNKYWIIRGWII